MQDYIMDPISAKEQEEVIQQETESFAKDLLINHLPEGFTYHNLAHTEQVVKAVKEIGKASQLSEDDIQTLILAAWFHDLGYIESYEDHEEVGMQMARDFFSKHELSTDRIDAICQLIEATKLEHLPRTLMERVIKDADLYNLATPDALFSAQLIREEGEIFRNEHFSDKKWNKMNLIFLENHSFFTEYGKTILEKVKKKNIQKLKKNLGKGHEKDIDVLAAELNSRKKSIKKLKKKLQKVSDQKPDRGIETMFRVTYRVHINLSSIADNKANILLSINAIIISIVLSAFVEQRSLDFGGAALAIPSGMLLVICLSTIVFAILSTRPQVNSGTFTRDDIIKKKTNLLFFGNFYRMDLDEYQWGINEMMKDSDYLYGSMAKDIYFLGKVLAKKFKLLRIAYNIFMYGMIVVVIAFIWAFFQ
ncbi:MAG: Pycsar system effector family protein [Bacteroidota bacterium]